MFQPISFPTKFQKMWNLLQEPHLKEALLSECVGGVTAFGLLEDRKERPWLDLEES